ncbi:MAG: hypothetical protein AAB393_17105, partial [Bacteroidota bacterium]
MSRPLTIILVTFFGVHSLCAQVSLTLTLKTPMPSQLSAWEKDKTLVQAIIINTSGTTYQNVRASFTIEDLDKGKVVASSKDNHPKMPRFNLPAGGTVVRSGPDL